MGDEDKHRDFAKHIRETVTIRIFDFEGKEEQRESVFAVSLNEKDLCSPPAPSIVRRTKEDFG